MAGLGVPRQRRRRRPSTTSVHLVYKVETHNSPSALDPYGGAITGIVGVNRDPVRHRARRRAAGQRLGLLLRLAVLRRASCPRACCTRGGSATACTEGVIDGGNQSGIPYGRGLGALRRPLPGQAAGLLRHRRLAAGHRGRTARRARRARGPATDRDDRRADRRRRHPRRDLLLGGARRERAGPGGADRRPDHAEADVRLPARGARPRAVQRDHRQRRRRALVLGRRDGAGARAAPGSTWRGAAQVRGPGALGDPGLRGPGAHDAGRAARSSIERVPRPGRGGARSRRRCSASSPTTAASTSPTATRRSACLDMEFLHDGAPDLDLAARWQPAALRRAAGAAARGSRTRRCRDAGAGSTSARARPRRATTTTRSRGSA